MYNCSIVYSEVSGASEPYFRLIIMLHRPIHPTLTLIKSTTACVCLQLLLLIIIHKLKFQCYGKFVGIW